MIGIISGLPGAGKSYKLGQIVIDLLYRNRKIYDRQMADFKANPRGWVRPGEMLPTPPVRRMIWTNLKLKPAVEAEFGPYISYWTELKQLTPLRDVDVVIDEVATYFDARLWETLSLEMRRWLAQHRKFGIEIYGTAQDFAQVDKAFRRLTSDLLYLTKLIGSGDISPTKPKIRFVWGIVLVQRLDPTVYDEQKSKFGRGRFPTFMLISRAGTDVFDTRAEVQLSSALPLKHIEKECERPDCAFHKTVHV